MENKKDIGTNQRINLLFFGMTGSGKSTLINMITNILFGVGYEDKRMISITQNLSLQKKGHSETVPVKMECNIKEFEKKQSDIKSSKGMGESQTQGYNTYTFQTEDYILTIADTPGMGDTKGIDKDKDNLRHIVCSIKELGSFHAVCLVHNASACKLNPSMKYAITELKGVLSEECKNNIVVCYTNVQNENNITATDALKALNIPLDHCFYFENECLMPPFEMAKIKTDEELEDYKDLSKVRWRSNTRNFKLMMDTVRKMAPQSYRGVNALYTSKQILFEIIQDEMKSVDELVRMKAKENEFLRSLVTMHIRAKDTSDFEVHTYEYVTVPQSYEVEEVNWVKKTNGKENVKCLICNDVCTTDAFSRLGFAAGMSLLTVATLGIGAMVVAASERKCCGHDMAQHKYTDCDIVKTKKSEIRNTYEQRPVVQTNYNKKHLHQQNELMIEKMQKDIDEIKVKSEKLASKLKLSCIKIAYLQNEIKKQSIEGDIVNPYMESYIDDLITAAKLEYGNNESKRQEVIGEYEELRKVYNAVKTNVSGVNNLTSIGRKELDEIRAAREKKEQVMNAFVENHQKGNEGFVRIRKIK